MARQRTPDRGALGTQLDLDWSGAVDAEREACAKFLERHAERLAPKLPRGKRGGTPIQQMIADLMIRDADLLRQGEHHKEPNHDDRSTT